MDEHSEKVLMYLPVTGPFLAIVCARAIYFLSLEFFLQGNTRGMVGTPVWL